MADEQPCEGISMERKTCIKCGNGVGLLVCRGRSCPVVVHESCIPPGSVQFSDKENFYCPYCMYDRSVAEFQNAREKAVLARRKISAFLGTETPEDEEFEPNTARYNRRMPQIHEHFGNQERAGEGKEGSHSMQVEDDAEGSECNFADTTVDEKGRFIRQCKGGHKVYECTNGIKMVGDQKNSHLLSFDGMRDCERRKTNVEYLSPMPLRVASGGVIRRYVCVNEWHEDGSSEIPEQPESGGKIYMSSNHRAEMYASISRDSIQNKLQSEKFIQPGNACDNPHGDEAYWCNDNDMMNCSTAGRIDNPGERSPVGVASDTKRKRLRWTNEEVDMLKKGVQFYSTSVKKNLPWRRILEFGRHVFNGSRSPSDLKDKWKLIARKEHLQSNDE